MVSTKKIILEYVCPSLGAIIANVMWLAPFEAVKKAILRGSLGALNPTPWAFMTGNCTGWLTYSFLKQDLFLFFGNVFGLVISFWLNMCAAKLQYQDHRATHMRSLFVNFVHQNRASFHATPSDDAEVSNNDAENPDTKAHPRTGSKLPPMTGDIAKVILRVTTQDVKAPTPHEKIFMVIIILWIAIVSLICLIPFSLPVKQYIVGITVNFNLLFFYGAPLSVIFKVVKHKNSVFIHRWTTLTNTANGIFWTAYGFSIVDYMIFIPNGLGTLLCFVQFFLMLVFPRSELDVAAVAQEEKGETS